MGGGNDAGRYESLVDMSRLRRVPGPKSAHRPVPAPVLAQYHTITRPCDRCRAALFPQEEICPSCAVEFGELVGMLDALAAA